jgi:hypothetical protein
VGWGGVCCQARLNVVVLSCRVLTCCSTHPFTIVAVLIPSLEHSLAFTLSSTGQYISTTNLALVVNTLGEQIVKNLLELFRFVGEGIPFFLKGNGTVDIDDSDSRVGGASATITWWGHEEGSGGVYPMAFLEEKVEEGLKAMTAEGAKKWLRDYLILLTRVDAFILLFAETRAAQLQQTELEDGKDGIRGSRFWNRTKSDCGCAVEGGAATLKLKGKM